MLGLQLLLPETSQNMDPRCRRKSVQTHDTVHGTWMTASVPLFIATANRSSLASFAGAAKPLSNERHPYVPPCRCEILGCSSPFDTTTSSNKSNNESSKFRTSAAAVYYYGIWTHSVYLRIFHLRIFQHHCTQQP